MSDNPGEINIRYNVDQASITAAIKAATDFQFAIDEGEVSMQGWSKSATAVVQAIDKAADGFAFGAKEIVALSEAFKELNVDTTQLPAELIDVTNRLLVLQAALDKTKQSVQALGDEFNLDAEIEKQWASAQAAGQFDPWQDRAKSGISQDYTPPPSSRFGMAKDVPEELLRKYGAGRDSDFQPAPYNMANAQSVLADASKITGSTEALQHFRDTLKDALDSMDRLDFSTIEVNKNFTNLAQIVLDFGESKQQLIDVAAAVDKINTTAIDAGDIGANSLRQVAIEADQFIQKFNLIRGGGLDVSNAPEVAVSAPIGGANIPGLTDSQLADLSTTVTPQTMELLSAVKQFTAQLSDMSNQFDRSDPEIRDFAGIFVTLNEQMKDSPHLMADINDAIEKMDASERDMASMPDMFISMYNAANQFREVQLAILDNAQSMGGAGGAGGPLPTGSNNGLPFAGAGEAGGLSDELDNVAAKQDIVAEKWRVLTNYEEQALSSVQGLTTQFDAETGQVSVLVQNTEEYAQAMEKVERIAAAVAKDREAIMAQDSLQFADNFVDKAQFGDVTKNSAATDEIRNAQALEFLNLKKETKAAVADEYAALQKGREALDVELQATERLNATFIDLDSSAADFDQKLEAAFEIGAALADQGKNWVVTLDEADALAEQMAQRMSAAGGGGTNGPGNVGGDNIPPIGPFPDMPEMFGGDPNKPKKYLTTGAGIGSSTSAKEAAAAYEEILKSAQSLASPLTLAADKIAEFDESAGHSSAAFNGLAGAFERMSEQADIENIVTQFATLTTRVEDVDQNAATLRLTLRNFGVDSTDALTKADELFRQLVDSELNLVSVQDQLNTKQLNLTVAGSGSNVPGAPESAAITDNTFNIKFSEEAQAAAQVNTEVNAILQSMLVLNPAADKTSFAFQNMAAAAQEIQQAAAIDNIAKQFYALSDSIGSTDDSLETMVNYLKSVGVQSEQIDQAINKFNELKAVDDALITDEENRLLLQKQIVVGYGEEGGAIGPAAPPEGAEAGTLGQGAIPAEGLRRTGTAISQLGLGNRGIQQIGTDIRLIGDVQQVNKEIGILSEAFTKLPGVMGDIGRSAAEMATLMGGPALGSIAAMTAVLAPFAAAAAVGVIAWQKLQEELKASNDSLVEANASVTAYFDALSSGTDESIKNQLEKLQGQKDAQDKILETQKEALAHGFESAQNEFGDPLARIFFALGQTGLSGGDAMKKMGDEMGKAGDKSVELAGQIDGLTRAENSSEVAANQRIDTLIKNANEQMSISKQEASDLQMTSDAAKKRLSDLKEEQTLLEATQAALNKSTDWNQKLSDEMDKNSLALQKNADEQKFLTDTAMPLIDAREKEAAAMKAQQQALDEISKDVVKLDYTGLVQSGMARSKLAESGTPDQVRGAISDAKTETDLLTQSLKNLEKDLVEGKITQDDYDKATAAIAERTAELKDLSDDYSTSLLNEVETRTRTKDITDELKQETDAYLKKQQDEINLRQGSSDKLAQIEQDYGDKLIQIAAKARDSAASALQELQQKEANNLQKLSDQTSDDATKLANTERDARIKASEQEAKEWQDHFNKLAQIRKSAEEEEYDEIANRDFAALARTRRQENDKITTENDSYVQKKAQEQQNLTDELKMDELHAKDQATQRLVEYERENRDAQQQYTQKLQDAQTAYEKEKAAADEARAKEINATATHLNEMLNLREEKYQEELAALRSHLQDEINVINGTTVSTQGGYGYSYGPQNAGATQPFANPNPGLQVFSPSQYGASAPTFNTNVTGNTIAVPNLNDLINGVEQAGIGLLQDFLGS